MNSTKLRDQNVEMSELSIHNSTTTTIASGYNASNDSKMPLVNNQIDKVLSIADNENLLPGTAIIEDQV